MKLSCVWQKDVQAEVCESCIRGCRLKPGKRQCRQTCVNEKSCVWQAALDQAALDQAALNQAALDQAALDQAAVDQAAVDQAALDQGAECSDDDPDYCAAHMDPFPMMCSVALRSLCMQDAIDSGETYAPGQLDYWCGGHYMTTTKLYEYCKKSCNQCTQACKDTDGIRCADITSAMGTRTCSLSIASINQEFFPGYSGDTSTKLSEVCKKSCEKC